MPRFRAAAWVVISLFLVPAVVAAQSLADAAAKEKEKKKAATAKVYTEDDLKRAGASGVYSAPEGQPSPDASAKPDSKDPKAVVKEKSDDEAKAEKQAAWHKQLEKAQADVTATQKAIDDIQAALGQSQSYYSPSRGKAVADLDAAKAKLAQAQQAVSDLEEEGRRNGFR
jgi:hypothetical protein